MQILQVRQSGPDLDRAGAFTEDQCKPMSNAAAEGAPIRPCGEGAGRTLF